MSDSELSAALDLNIHEPFDTASGYMTDWDITNTGGNYQRNEPIPYTDYTTFGNAFACGATSTYPTSGQATCSIELKDRLDEPTSHPIYFDFLVSASAGHDGHTQFYIELEDNDGNLSKVNWSNNVNNYMNSSYTGIFSTLSDSLQLREGNTHPRYIKLGFFMNKTIELSATPYPTGTETKVTGSHEGLVWPITLRLIVKQYDFWGSNRQTIIDEIKVYKETQTEKLTGPF